VTNETLGERLKKVREGRGLDLREVEAALNVRGQYLECLEEGNYKDLPGEVYVKNFLKVYGVFLGMEGEEIIEQYEKERKVDDYKMMTQNVAGERDLFGNKSRRGWSDFSQRLGLSWKQAASRGQERMSFRNIVLSQIFIKGIIGILILGVLFYLGFEINKIITPPDLTVLKPVDNLLSEELNVEILGIVEEGAILTINGSEVMYEENGRFEEMVDLRPGLNEIKIAARKKHSRENVVYRRIIVE